MKRKFLIPAVALSLCVINASAAIANESSPIAPTIGATSPPEARSSWLAKIENTDYGKTALLLLGAVAVSFLGYSRRHGPNDPKA